MSTYLVTGGAGFIGSHLVKRLLNDGHEVRVIDNLSTGKFERLAPVFGNQLLRYQHPCVGAAQDILSRTTCSVYMKGVDYVLHQAALPSVARSVADPLATMENNVMGTTNVLHHAQLAGVKRVVLACSSSAYGGRVGYSKLQDESMPRLPKSPYAASKVAGEYIARSFFETYGLQTVCLRYFNVFGPDQDPNAEYAAVVPKFITRALAGEPLDIEGTGEQYRDFCYVDNVVEANLLACAAPAEAVAGQVFNVGCGEQTSINELAALIKELTGSKSPIRHVQPRTGDVKASCADMWKAKSNLGYLPRVSFKDGLAETVAWFRERA